MNRNQSHAAFNIAGYTFLTLLALLCLLPCLLVLSGSFSSERQILTIGYTLIPEEFSTDAYHTLFKSIGEVLNAYGVTIFVTVCGTLAGLFCTAMTGYVLSRRNFRYRNQVSFLIFFTTMFSGGLIPWYILMVRTYHLKDSLLALILPSLLAPFYIFVMRNYVKSIPESVIESAKMDGAGEWRILVRLILPMCVPALATVGLFIALDYWNSWMPALLFIDDRAKYPLQYFLYRMLSSVRFASVVSAKSGVPTPDLPNESIKMAMSVIATGPIIFLYPFVQKYFISGITIGAVKE
ncbi:MAG: carbohydrate ABC transporter permease [Spirochaetales bacterium]|nr:carbohydrate ABC transporter permease [Spirochaetales bacterium]